MHWKTATLSIQTQSGFTLVELMLVVLLSTILITGMVQIVAAASASFRLQDNQAEVMENARHAIKTISKAIRQSGFTPEPWNPEFSKEALMPETQDQISTRSDRIVLRSWSDTNCFDNQNPVSDENGDPVFFIRESLFDLNSTRNLAHTCRYGPSDSELITQVNHQGFVRNVDSFQALYGEDIDGDGQVDLWVKGRDWADSDRVLAVRIGLLLFSTDAVLEPSTKTFEVLDKDFVSQADGRIRELFTFTTAIRRSDG